MNLKKVDSFEFESRFSTDDCIKYDEIRDSNVSFKDMEPFLDRLPERERDLITLYYHLNKNQKDIAKIFGVTQGAVSSRLARARKRLQFLRDMPKIPTNDIELKLKEIFEPIEIEIIKCMIKTTCQSETAFLINKKFNLIDEKKKMTQVKVRHRFEKCIISLETKMRTNPKLKKYHTLLEIIKDNLYLLHEVKLPHFDRGRYAVYSYNTD